MRHRLKSMLFYPTDTALNNSNNFVLTSYLGGIYMVFLVDGRIAENIEVKKKTDRRKTLKSEEKEKRRIRAMSNNNNINLWF